MADSKTVIANMALRHIKIGKEIGNLDTEKSPEAEAVRVYYETLRQSTLRDFDWGFATKYQVMSLVQLQPTTEWNFSYRMPSDCVRFRRILSGSRNDNRYSRVPFSISADNIGALILTDTYQAQCEYTFNNQVESTYPPDFVLAFSFNIAAHIAASLTGGDPFKLGDNALKMYMMYLSKAAAHSANESQPDMLPESSFINIRNV